MKIYEINFEWTSDSWPIIIHYTNVNNIQIKNISQLNKIHVFRVECNELPSYFLNMLYNCNIIQIK